MKEYPPEAWDVYPFQFSDGGNWKYDNDKAISLLRSQILPKSNMFCYGNVFLKTVVAKDYSWMKL